MYLLQFFLVNSSDSIILKRFFTQGAADAWEHRGCARLPQKGDVAQDGGGCWRRFTYEVDDDGDVVMIGLFWV